MPAAEEAEPPEFLAFSAARTEYGTAQKSFSALPSGETCARLGLPGLSDPSGTRSVPRFITDRAGNRFQMTPQPGEDPAALKQHRSAALYPRQSASSSTPSSPRLRADRFNGQAWILLLIALAFVAATRLLWLGDRVFYHDESLFAFYAWQLATTGTYTATDEATPGAATDLFHHPLLHGPLQMQLIGGVFYLARLLGVLGDGDAAARLLAALSGIALLFPILALRRQIHRQGVVFAAAMAAVSPGIWYYSRFCRNEAPFLLVTLMLVVVVSRGWRSRRPAGWIVAGCLLVATLVSLKENSLFILFDGASFAALLAVFDRRARATGSSADGLLKRRGAAALLGRSLSQCRCAWISGLALAWLLLEIVYTNGFQWPRSFLGMYVEQMKYWWGQHAEQRIHGEFHYHLPILALYEPLAVLILIVAVGNMLRGGRPDRKRRSPRLSLLTILLVVVGVLAGAFAGDIAGFLGLRGAGTGANGAPATGSGGPLDFLHMSRPWHLGLALGVAWLTLCGAWRSLATRRTFRAWLVWWMGLSFLQYSYAGEKVPWLSLHIALPLILLAADLLGEWWRGGRAGRGLEESFGRQQAATFLLALFFVANVLQGYRMCIVDPTNPAELLVYNHPDPGIAEIGREMRALAKDSEQRMIPFIQGKAVWPLVWYLRDCSYESAEGDEAPRLGSVDLVACDPAYAGQHPEVARRFDLTPRVMRRAWIPAPLHLIRPWERWENPRGLLAWLHSAGLISGVEENFPRGEPLAEDLDERDLARIRALRGRYGLGAWKALLRYIAYREPWGDRETTSVPETILFGPLKPPPSFP